MSGLSVPTLSFDAAQPADYHLPWPSSATLKNKQQGDIRRRLEGEYELTPPVDSENHGWSFGWDHLEYEEVQALSALDGLALFAFEDPLGRPVQGQLGMLRTPVRKEVLDDQGRLVYSGSCEVSLFSIKYPAWCPNFEYLRESTDNLRFYGMPSTTGVFSKTSWLKLDTQGQLIQFAPRGSSRQGALPLPTGTPENWGDLDPDPPVNWDRSVRDATDTSPPQPSLSITDTHLNPRRGSFFVALATT